MNLRTARQAYRRTSHTRVPVVLPTVRIQVQSDGSLEVRVDNDPDLGEDAYAREDLPQVVEDIATRFGSPVRVEVREADGTLYTDIAMPSTPDSDNDEIAEPHQDSQPEVGGRGFLPEEEIAVAVVVSTHVAAADGTARVRLPPALIGGTHADILLLGRSSGTVAVREAI